MLRKTHDHLYHYLFLVILVSSFVMIEPAPYDVLMIILIFGCLFFSFFFFHEETMLPLLALGIFLISNLISMFFVINLPIAFKFTGTTFYLAITMICLVGLGQHFKIPLLIISKGYLFSAVIATLIGIAAYFNLAPFSENLLLFGRVKSTFKDPNVFGPFLVLPALFAISMFENTKGNKKNKILYLLCFFLLTTGIILSFSRAAWGNFAISIFLYAVITKKEFIQKRLKVVLIILVLGLPLFIYFVQTPFVQDLFESRLSIKSYDSDRFSTQRASIETGIQNPLGMGPGQSELLFQYSPHSLYARILTENGILGFISLVSLLVIGITKSYKSYWQSSHDHSFIFIIIFASLVGLSFNSLFIDTLHWRHLWLILSLALFPVIQGENISTIKSS